VADESLYLLENVVKQYTGAVTTQVLFGVDLAIRPGEFLALMGASGSGKSTLLNLLGLLDRPTSGRMVLQGQEVQSLSDEERTRVRNEKLGFVFQFHHLLPAFTAVENIMLPMRIQRGRYQAGMRDRALNLLGCVGLAPIADKPVTTLSGGQQQRVAVARALALHPPLVLADEPTGNLDTQAAAQVLFMMRSFHQQLGSAFLIVTHDPRIAERCDRIVELVDGRVHADVPNTPPAEALGQPGVCVPDDELL